MFKIIIQDDEGKTTIVPFVREELTIGRKEGNTIRLTERNVSREHAKISRNDDVVSLEDMESYNGIRVNGTKIKGKVELKVSDRIQIGDYLLEIKPEKQESEAAGKNSAIPISHPDAETRPIIRNVDPDSTPMPELITPLVSAASLAETAPETKAPPKEEKTDLKDRAAKLVVLSTNYAGDEFLLEKRSMVIGRTEDNDIWLDHRSISRHHAKILREEDRYSVVDLQSSNGVRVNGEVYGKVELRKGDEVDLGHVRLRFVGHGEDFVFARDAEVVDLSKSTGGGAGKWLALIALLGAIGAGVYFMFPELLGLEKVATHQIPPVVDEKAGQTDLDVKATETTHTVVPLEPGEKTDTLDVPVEPTPVEPVEADATENNKVNDDDLNENTTNAVPVETTNGDVDEKMTALLSSADKARAEEKWRELTKISSTGLRTYPNEKRFSDDKALGQRESKAYPRYNEFQRALKNNRYAAAASSFKRIPANSIYANRARGSYDRLRRDYIAMQTAKARKFASAGNCAAQKRLANSVPKQWPEGRTAIMSVECSSKQSNTRQAPVVPVKPAEPVKTPDKTEPAPVETPTVDFDQLVADSKAAAGQSQYGKSYRLCKEALKAKPRDQEAIMICAIASCNLKNADAAKNYIGKIQSTTRKNNVVQICLSKGIEGL